MALTPDQRAATAADLLTMTIQHQRTMDKNAGAHAAHTRAIQLLMTSFCHILEDYRGDEKWCPYDHTGQRQPSTVGNSRNELKSMLNTEYKKLKAYKEKWHLT